MPDPQDKFDDLSILMMVKGDKNVSTADKIRVDMEIARKDAERNKALFDSMNANNHKGKILGAFLVGALLLSTLVIGVNLKTSDTGTQDTNASLCGDLEIPVLEDGNLVCKECSPLEYGKLDLCEKDSPTGKCKKSQSGCYMFDFD